MDSKDLIKAVNVLHPNKVVPIHHRGWTHFKEKEITLKNSLQSNVLTKDRTIFLKSGERTKI